MSWIQSLATWVIQICMTDLLLSEIQNKFASWNGYPMTIRNAIIKWTVSKSSRQEQLHNYHDMIKLYIDLPYMRNAGKQLVRRCIKKLERNIRKEVQVKFVLSFFNNMKDRITNLASSFIAYDFCCPGCHHNYTGKKGRTLWKRINEHGYRDRDSVIYNHITNCKGVSYLIGSVRHYQ